MPNYFSKLLELAPNILNKQNTQAFIQQAPQVDYGNFAQNMDAIQQQANNQALNNTMNELKIQNPQEQPVQANDINGVKNKLLSGFTDFQRGYNENVNSSFAPENFGNNQFTNVIPANTEKLANYQTQLLAQGLDPNVVSAVAQGKNSGNVDIDNWIKANPDAFNPTTQTFEKNPMGRIGEFAGTAAKFANSPAGQALIQGALVGLANQDWGKGVAAGLQAAQDRAASNMYSNALRAEGLDMGSPTIFGNISQKDYASIMNQKDKQWDRDYKVKKFEADENYRTKDLARREEDSKNNREYREKMLGLKGEELKIKRTRAARKGGGGRGGLTAAQQLKIQKEKEKKAKEQAMWDAAGKYKERIETPVGKNIWGKPIYMSPEEQEKMKWAFKQQFHKDPDDLIY